MVKMVENLTNFFGKSKSNNLIALMGKSIVIILLAIVLVIIVVFLIMILQGLIPLLLH
jgi:hypothetical protein